MIVRGSARAWLGLMFLLPALSGIAGAQGNGCRLANDGQCDEPGYGEGVCFEGTDTDDCRGMTQPPDINDSCRSARDGSCDEPVVGTGSCAAGKDATDCAGFGQNSCRFAADGECDEPGIGTALCLTGADTADCRPGVAAAPTKPRPPAADSCQWAGDGVCDEPYLCPPSTDTTDCRPVPVKPR